MLNCSFVLLALFFAPLAQAGVVEDSLFELAPRTPVPSVFSEMSFSAGASHLQSFAQAARGKASEVQTKIDRDLASIRDRFPTPHVSTGIDSHVDRIKLMVEEIGREIQEFERLLK